MEIMHFLRHIIHDSIDIAGCVLQLAFLYKKTSVNFDLISIYN